MDQDQEHDGGEIRRTYQQASAYILVRPRSRQDVVRYLKRKHWSDGIISEVVRQLEETGLIDDRQYASNWIVERQQLHMRSRRQMEMELLRKGLDHDVVSEVLSEQVFEKEEDTLSRLARKKMGLSQFRQPQKLAQYLVRQGYEYSLVKTVLGRLELNDNQ